jgi:CBS domain-containing protein
LEVFLKIDVNPEIFLTYRARDIQTKMSDRPICIDVDEAVPGALEKLKKFGFDQAPVLSDGAEIGYLLTKDLEGAKNVESIFHRLSPDDLISADAPLNDLLQRLVDKGLIFIVGKSGIDGFVVPSDIGRHVSRAHLYLLISGLEILMTRIVSTENLSAEELTKYMSPGSREARESQLRQGLDANPVEYLDIKGLGKLMARLKTPLIHLGVKEADWDSYIEGLNSLRNWVAHSNTEQMTRHPFEDIVRRVQTTEKYIRKLNSYE